MDKKKTNKIEVKQTSEKKKEATKTVKSDTPTLAIAPSDYEHIYTIEKAPVAVNQKIMTTNDCVKAIKSDTPTVAIAPSDFEHIYAAEKTPNKITSGKENQVVQVIKSETPTVAIAPSDFEHIYAAEKARVVVSPKAPRPTTDNDVKATKSDTPTVAIAPSDYEHIYAANKIPVVAPKVHESIQESQPVKTFKSNTLTVAIAPSDYEHIYTTKVDKPEEKQVEQPQVFNQFSRKLTIEKEMKKITPKNVTALADYDRATSVKPEGFGARKTSTGISPEVLQVVARFARAQAQAQALHPTLKDIRKDQKYKK